MNNEQTPPPEMDPFKVGLISLMTKDSVNGMVNITASETYHGTTQQFHPEGLYSVDAFGLRGTSDRMENFAYISLNCTVIIPDIYVQLLKARAYYGEIMAGKLYAVFDTTINDFTPTAIEDGGQTGFSFFIKHLPKLQVEESDSSSRQRLIKLIDKYRNKLLTRYFLVIPAGYRDIETREDGRDESDEINKLYLAVMRNARNILSEDVSLDPLRYAVQKAVVEVSAYIDNINYGKHGRINATFAKRAVRHGTRNVITSQIHNVSDLDSPANLGLLDVTMGVTQLLHSYPDMIGYQVREIMRAIMPDEGYDFSGINPVTRQDTTVAHDRDLYQLLMSQKGFVTLIKLLKVKENRTRPILHDGQWVGAIYKPAGAFQIISSLEELPPDYEWSDVHPITLVELVYIASWQIEDKLVGTSTRPPVLGQGGIYGSHRRIDFTAEYEIRKELYRGEPTGRVAGRFPLPASGFKDSFTVSELNLGPLGGDFDGDALSSSPTTTEEAIAEIKESLHKASYYRSTYGTLLYGLSGVDVANNVLLTITRK